MGIRGISAGILFLLGELAFPLPLSSAQDPITGEVAGRTMEVIGEKKKEVQNLIAREEPTNDETVLRCLRSKHQALEELERAVLRLLVQFTIEKEKRQARVQKIAWEGSPIPGDIQSLQALLSKAESEAIKIADEAYLCLSQESGGPIFPYSTRAEPPPQDRSDLPLPLLSPLEPDPRDRPFSPITP